MTTQQIGYFLKLAEELNYTNVARIFFITQPTLSKQIVNLENELKITLFHRDHNAVQLTPAGKKFYERVKPIFLDLMDAVREAQSYEDDRDNLTIGIQEEQLISNSFMLAINLLRHDYPDLKIAIHRAGSEELLEGLNNGKFDIVNMMAYPTYRYSDKYNFLSLDDEDAYLAYPRKLMKLADKITQEELKAVLKEHELILPYVLNTVDDEQAKKIFLENYKIQDGEEINLRIVQSGRPISLPLQVSSGLGVSVCNRTNLLMIDPEVNLAQIADTEHSYDKGLFYSKQPGNPYIKLIIKKTREEHEKYRASLNE